MKNFKISQLQNNQFILQDFDNNTIYFQSYDSKICKIENHWKITLYPHFDFSKTTSKYLHEFLNKFTCYGDEIFNFIKKENIKKNKSLQYGKYYIVYEEC